MPTSSEILKLLLAVANPTQDFASIIQKANYFIFLSLIEYDMTCFRYSSVALASLMCVLDELGYSNFQTNLMEVIEIENINFDIAETLKCKQSIVNHVNSTS